MYRFVFEMESSDESIAVYIIPLAISAKEAEDFIKRSYGDFDLYDKYTADLEGEYGVHDFCTSGDYELIGYSSYEIADDKQLELMQKWREVLVKLGLNPQDIIKMTVEDYEKAFENE